MVSIKHLLLTYMYLCRLWCCHNLGGCSSYKYKIHPKTLEKSWKYNYVPTSQYFSTHWPRQWMILHFLNHRHDLLCLYPVTCPYFYYWFFQTEKVQMVENLEKSWKYNYQHHNVYLQIDPAATQWYCMAGKKSRTGQPNRSVIWNSVSQSQQI